MTHIKKSISFFLCLFVLIHSGGIDLLLTFYQKNLKNQVQKELSIQFNHKSISEIRINGVNYDVVTSFNKEGKKVTTYIKDEKETKFEKKATAFHKKNNAPKNKHLLKIKTPLFCTIYQDIISFYKTRVHTSKSTTINNSKKPIVRFCDIHSPPPEWC